MKLYLIRHGAAVDVGQHGVKTDAARMLSREGIEKTSAVARALNPILGGDLKRIVSSPLARAKETAEIMAATLSPGVEVELAEELASGADVREAVAWLSRQPHVPTMLVGHMPDLSDLASRLISGADAARIDFKKSAIACIVFEHGIRPGEGCLEWLLPPGVIRRLAAQ